MSEQQILAIKLTSGEEIIGKAVGSTPEGIVVSKPYQIGFNPGTGAMSMMPFMIYMSPEARDNGVLIAVHSIITAVPVNQELADAYSERTGGVAVARSQIIT